MPLGLTGDFNEENQGSGKEQKNTRGTVTINYLHYTVNQGKGLVPFAKKGAAK
jgi:hypothetical protein